jgi:hypothetical protein
MRFEDNDLNVFVADVRQPKSSALRAERPTISARPDVKEFRLPWETMTIDDLGLRHSSRSQTHIDQVIPLDAPA